MKEIPVTYTTVCKDCDEEFTETTTTGPVNICMPCARKRTKEIFKM